MSLSQAPIPSLRDILRRLTAYLIFGFYGDRSARVSYIEDFLYRLEL